LVLATPAFTQICDWANLQTAHHLAALGKRGRPSTAAFEHQLADQLLQLQAELRTGAYRPQPYTHFMIHEPKRRCISAAAFRDRVVHHALCLVIEPRFERVFIPDSFANRVGKGTHAAVLRLAQFARGHRYVLRADIRQHFPSIDHAVLLQALQSHIAEADVMDLIATIVASGDWADGEDRPAQHFFAGDDLLCACRPCGLPIGNLTSQFWSNCYLHPLDLFVKRELGCNAYLRYVDDFALFSDSKAELWSWKAALRERLARLRLTMHENSTQVAPTATGIPWLGFVVYPTHKLLKARKVRHASRRLGMLYGAWHEGAISFAEFDAAVQGWINHVRHADSWGLRGHVLAPFVLPAGFEPHYPGRVRVGR
jgi:RNA-directed DNA polymerase